MIIRDFIIKEHRVLTEAQARAQLMEDPIYRQFKSVGQYITERRMSEKEILQVFADAEAGMTDKATGANRTMLGRGKDTTMDFAGGVKDAMTSVLNSIQNSVPVAAVDVAYDQATDALANVAGGQKGAVMSAIKKYRNLVKQYPKTAGFAKAALVAIAGLATGGAGLAAIAGLTYALDSAIKGDKLSSVLGKGAGAAALAAAGQAVSGAMNPGQPDIGNVSGGQDIGGYNPDNVPGDLMTTPEPGWQSNADVSGMYAQEPGWPGSGAEGGAAGVDGGTYTVMKGDQGGFIAQANGVPFKDLQALNPDITNWNKLPVGTELNLPPSGDNVGSVWQGTDMSAPGVAPANTGMNPTDMNNFRADNLARVQDQADAAYYAGKPDDYGWVNNKFNATNLGPNFDPNKVPAGMTMKQGASPVRESIWTKVAESVKFKTLPVDRLIDDRITILSWALNESIGRKSKSINLTAAGAYTIFENVDRYRKEIIKERKGVPGSTRPAYYRPDMVNAPTTPDKKPGMIGRGLNWLDKTAGKVGGALSNFGHQFTTDVTKEKLKMNWHQDGKFSDSDQLAAWLVKQGVPQQVVTTVYNKMGIPHTAPAAAPGDAAPAATPPPASPTPSATPSATPTGTATAPVATPGTPAATNAAGWNDPKSANYVGRREVARRQTVQPAASATPNFGQQGGGYAKVNQPTTMKYSGVQMGKPAAAPAPVKQPTNNTNAYVDSVNKAEADRLAMGANRYNESLSWSRNFNPGMTLFRQMKQAQS